MQVFYDSVCTQVVSADVYVLDMVLPFQIPEHGDKGFAIVRDNFDESAPSAEDILEDPFSECLCVRSPSRACRTLDSE